MIKIVDDQFSKDEWNNVVGHPMQSWEWGEMRKVMGIGVMRVGVFKKDKLIEAYQLTVHNLPIRQLAGKRQVAYIPRSIWPSEQVLDFLYEWGKENKIIFIKLEPYEDMSNVKNQMSKPQLKTQNFIRSSHQLFPDWTIILDINEPEEKLLKDMKSKTRYNIRLAQKKGVVVKEMTNKDGFEIFWKLYSETMKRQKYFGHDYRYHKTVFENLKNKIAYIFVAYLQAQPLAAYELFIFKDRAYYPYGGSSLEQKQVMAPNLLMWEALRFAKTKGAKYFDMWGASAPAASEKDIYAGFTRFKEGYGGRYLEFAGSYDLIINSNFYTLYSLLYKLRRVMLNLV